jgi:hypothetical protein
MIKVNKLLTAYVEKTGRNVTGFLEFYSVCGYGMDEFIPKFEVNQIGVTPFLGFSNVTVGNIAFSAYCGDGSFIGREPIAAEAIYEFSKNLRFTEMQSK